MKITSLFFSFFSTIVLLYSIIGIGAVIILLLIVIVVKLGKKSGHRASSVTEKEESRSEE